MLVAFFLLLHAALQRLNYSSSLFKAWWSRLFYIEYYLLLPCKTDHICISTLCPSKKIDSIQGSVKRKHRKLLGRHYLFSIFSNVVKGPVWLDLTVFKWRPQLARVERQLGKLFLSVLQLLAGIFKLKVWCLAVSYFGCCKNLGVPGTGQIFSVKVIFKWLTFLNQWDKRQYLVSRGA